MRPSLEALAEKAAGIFGQSKKTAQLGGFPTMPDASAKLGSGTGDGIQVSGREENWSTVATPGQLAFNRHVHETSETAES